MALINMVYAQNSLFKWKSLEISMIIIQSE